MSNLNVGIKNILNSTLESVKNIIPMDVNIGSPKLVNSANVFTEMGVVVGITGDLYGQLIISSDKKVLSNIGTAMFGMELSEDMLPSFVGEFGNMLVGNTSTVAYSKGTVIDITPPTVVEGESRIYGFEKGIQINTEVIGSGNLIITLSLKEK